MQEEEVKTNSEVTEDEEEGLNLWMNKRKSARKRGTPPKRQSSFQKKRQETYNYLMSSSESEAKMTTLEKDKAKTVL